MKIRPFAALSGLLFLFGLFSCSIRQDLTLSGTGGGTGRLEVSLQPVLVEYLTDLAAVMSDAEDPESLPLFDREGIRNAFAGSTGVELTGISIPRRETLILDFRFTDLNRPFQELPGARRNLVSFRRQGDRNILDLYFSLDNFFQATAFFPLMDEDVMAYFGPNPENPVSDELYKEDLELALEEYLGDSSVDRILEQSRVSLHVKVDGEILSLSGGKREAGGAVFETPLLRFLTLTTPVEYRLEYRPRQ